MIAANARAWTRRSAAYFILLALPRNACCLSRADQIGTIKRSSDGTVRQTNQGNQTATSEPTLADAARRKLAPYVDNFFASAASDLCDVETLHQMRIAGKQVRYAMELLAGAFEKSPHHDLNVTFTKVQEKLGSINDHATAITLFDAWNERGDCSESRAELAELIASERIQLSAACQEFRNWWTTDRASELAERFARLLQSDSLPNADLAAFH